jgi:hypothetical protein
VIGDASVLEFVTYSGQAVSAVDLASRGQQGGEIWLPFRLRSEGRIPVSLDPQDVVEGLQIGFVWVIGPKEYSYLRGKRRVRSQKPSPAYPSRHGSYMRNIESYAQ